jgi:TP901 family phage tail tape measure protein
MAALSKELGYQRSEAQLLEGAYQSLSSGFSKTADLQLVLRNATKLSVGGFADMETSTKALAAALNAYNLGAAGAERVTKVLLGAQDAGVQTVAELAQQMGDIAPIAAAMNVSIEEAFAAVSTLTLAGVPAAEAATQFKAIMSDIIKPSKQAREAFEEILKAPFSEVQKLVREKGLLALVDQLKAAGATSPETLGRLFEDVRSLNGALILAGSKTEDFKKIIGSIGQTDANKNFKLIAESIDGEFTALKNKFANFDKDLKQGEFGKALVALLKSLGDSLPALGENINKFIAGIKAGFAAIAPNLESAQKSFALLGQSISNLLSAGGADFSKLDIGKLIVDGLKLAIDSVAQFTSYLATLINSNREQILSFVKQAKDVAGQAFNLLKPLGLELIETVKVAAPLIAKIGGYFLTLAAAAIPPVIKGVTLLLQGINAVLRSPFGEFLVILAQVAGSVLLVVKAFAAVKIVIGVVAAAVAALTSPIGIVIAAITGIVAAFVAVKNNWDNIVRGFNSSMQAIKGWIDTYILSPLSQVRDFISNALPQPLKDILKPITDIGIALGDSLLSPFREALKYADWLKNKLGEFWDWLKKKEEPNLLDQVGREKVADPIPGKSIYYKGQGVGVFEARRGGGTRPHNGVDFEGAVGTNVQAVLGGRVTEHWENAKDGQGFSIVTALPDGRVFKAKYTHVQNRLPEGTIVQAGQKVAEIGRHGNQRGSVGYHLDLKTQINGQFVPPGEWAKQAQAALPAGGVQGQAAGQGGSTLATGKGGSTNTSGAVTLRATAYTPGGRGIDGGLNDAKGRLIGDRPVVALTGSGSLKYAIPYGSKVLVEYNGRSVEAEVADVISAKGSAIDLSPGVWRKLGFNSDRDFGRKQVGFRLIQPSKKQEMYEVYEFGTDGNAVASMGKGADAYIRANNKNASVVARFSPSGYPIDTSGAGRTINSVRPGQSNALTGKAAPASLVLSPGHNWDYNTGEDLSKGVTYLYNGQKYTAEGIANLLTVEEAVKYARSRGFNVSQIQGVGRSNLPANSAAQNRQRGILGDKLRDLEQQSGATIVEIHYDDKQKGRSGLINSGGSLSPGEQALKGRYGSLPNSRDLALPRRGVSILEVAGLKPGTALADALLKNDLDEARAAARINAQKIIDTYYSAYPDAGKSAGAAAPKRRGLFKPGQKPFEDFIPGGTSAVNNIIPIKGVFPGFDAGQFGLKGSDSGIPLDKLLAGWESTFAQMDREVALIENYRKRGVYTDKDAKRRTVIALSNQSKVLSKAYQELSTSQSYQKTTGENKDKLDALLLKIDTRIADASQAKREFDGSAKPAPTKEENLDKYLAEIDRAFADGERAKAAIDNEFKRGNISEKERDRRTVLLSRKTAANIKGRYEKRLGTIKQIFGVEGRNKIEEVLARIDALDADAQKSANDFSGASRTLPEKLDKYLTEIDGVFANYERAKAAIENNVKRGLDPREGDRQLVVLGQKTSANIKTRYEARLRSLRNTFPVGENRNKIEEMLAKIDTLDANAKEPTTERAQNAKSLANLIKIVDNEIANGERLKAQIDNAFAGQILTKKDENEIARQKAKVDKNTAAVLGKKRGQIGDLSGKLRGDEFDQARELLAKVDKADADAKRSFALIDDLAVKVNTITEAIAEEEQRISIQLSKVESDRLQSVDEDRDFVAAGRKAELQQQLADFYSQYNTEIVRIINNPKLRKESKRELEELLKRGNAAAGGSAEEFRRYQSEGDRLQFARVQEQVLRLTKAQEQAEAKLQLIRERGGLTDLELQEELLKVRRATNDELVELLPLLQALASATAGVDESLSNSAADLYTKIVGDRDKIETQLDKKTNSLKYVINDLKGSFTELLQTGIEGLFDGLTNGADAFTNALNNIYQGLGRIASKIITSGLEKWLTGSNSVGGGDGGWGGIAAQIAGAVFGGGFASGGIIGTDNGSILRALSAEGNGARLVVGHVGEAMLSARTGDAQLYKSLQDSGQWQALKNMTNFSSGGYIGAPPATAALGQKNIHLVVDRINQVDYVSYSQVEQMFLDNSPGIARAGADLVSQRLQSATYRGQVGI